MSYGRRVYDDPRSMSVVDEYLAGLVAPEREALERVRKVVQATVPGVEESRIYGMPAFRYKRRPLLGFRASKNHLSVFPFSAAAVDAVRHELSGFDLSKGTVRFTSDRPIPNSALRALLRYRLSELEDA
jgi:uncharacterized protein YdhG (YjbR/CyaY superfamily)